MLTGSMSACLTLYSWETLKSSPASPAPPPLHTISFSSSGALTKDLATVLETSALHLHRGVVTHESPVPLHGEGSDPRRRSHKILVLTVKETCGNLSACI